MIPLYGEVEGCSWRVAAKGDSVSERFRGNTFDQHLLLLTLTALTGVLRGVLVVTACLEVQIS